MDDVLIAVDEDLCIGSGACEARAPEGIAVGDDAIAHPTGVRLPLAVAEEVCEGCPSGAVRIVG